MRVYCFCLKLNVALDSGTADKELKSALKTRSQKEEGLRGQYCHSLNQTIKSGHYFDSMDSERLVKSSTKQRSLDTVSTRATKSGKGGSLRLRG